METGKLENKIAKLPDDLKIKVEDYVDALLVSARKTMKLEDPAEIYETSGKPRSQFGSGKGTFGKMTNGVDAPVEEEPKLKREFGGLKGFVTYMADDFDAPLEDFKDYM